MEKRELEEVIESVINRFSPFYQQFLNLQSAMTFYIRLQEEISHYSQSLKEDEELFVQYNGQANNPILVLAIGFCNPSLIVLSGLDTLKNQCVVLAHMQSVQLTLTVSKIKDDGERNAMPQFIGEVKGVH